MSITVTVTLSNAQALAVLKSDGLSRGWGVRKSQALQKAELKLLDAIQLAYNNALEGK